MSESLLFGVKEDLSNLVSQHSQKKSYDYDDFMKTWLETKFYYIFSGRPNLEEMKLFVENALMIVKEICLAPSTGDFEKTAALFLLYTVYSEQPLINPAKIRIELEEFKEMNNFVNRMTCVSKDIPFAFFSLIHKAAFHYVFSYLVRTAEKTGVVDIRDSFATQEKRELQKFEKFNISEVLEEIGFEVDDYTQLEAIYNSDLQEICENQSVVFPGRKQPEIEFEPHLYVKDTQASIDELYTIKPVQSAPRHHPRSLEHGIFTHGPSTSAAEETMVDDPGIPDEPPENTMNTVYIKTEAPSLPVFDESTEEEG